MENPQLYSASNALQKRDAAIVLSEFIPLMDFSEEDVILDVGSGSGDITRNLLLPNCSAFQEMIGVDMCEEMVSFARKHFSHDRLSYRQMDVSQVNQPKSLFPDGFTKIFSFYCLHWIKNYSRVLSNFYQLLRPNGTCLLVFLAKNPVFDAYKNLSVNNKWAEYMDDVDKYIPVYQESTEPAREFQAVLEANGFQVLHCTASEFNFVFPNLNILRNALKAVNPFVSRIPVERQNEFMDDCITEIQRLKIPVVDGKITAKYNVMVAFAQKGNCI